MKLWRKQHAVKTKFPLLFELQCWIIWTYGSSSSNQQCTRHVVWLEVYKYHQYCHAQLRPMKLFKILFLYRFKLAKKGNNCIWTISPLIVRISFASILGLRCSQQQLHLHSKRLWVDYIIQILHLRTFVIPKKNGFSIIFV